MIPKLYKKSGWMVVCIARDFYNMTVGERLPTIVEYTEHFDVSRGIVQKAQAFLEEQGCIEVERSGARGTFLKAVDYEKLYPFTEWGSLTGTMPVPLTDSLASLTTAICEEMGETPFPFSFAYVTGSSKRLEALENTIYDFIIVSKSSALNYLEQYEFLELGMELTGCIYSRPYHIFFLDPEKDHLEDGMTIAVDETSTDQHTITQKLIADYHLHTVQLPYIVIADREELKAQGVDCFVYRQDGWMDASKRMTGYPIPELPGFSEEEMVTPVILVNKQNYGLTKLLSRYVNPERTRQIQQAVLDGKAPVKFF